MVMYWQTAALTTAILFSGCVTNDYMIEDTSYTYADVKDYYPASLYIAPYRTYYTNYYFPPGYGYYRGPVYPYYSSYRSYPSGYYPYKGYSQKNRVYGNKYYYGTPYYRTNYIRIGGF